MDHERMLDKTHQPSTPEILAAIGEPLGSCWAALDQFLRDTYDIEPECRFDGPKYGWALHYRKGGRPLCDITPVYGGFTALVVLGAKEGEMALAALDTFGPNVRGCLENARVYHDGRWLFIRALDQRDVDDIRRLVLFKRKPPKKKAVQI